MDNGASSQTAIRSQSGNIGFSVLTTILIAAMPKCPICWMALTGALGVGSLINSDWLQPLAVTLLLLSVGALFVRARRRRGYGPFFLGVAASLAIYLCKFMLNFDTGVYLGGATLLGASIWNAVPKRRAAASAQCHC